MWRPWEVALFAQCSSQDTMFKDAVTGPHGLPSLVAALDSMLAEHLLVREIHWENVALTLRALAFVSEQEWVVAAVDPAIIPSLLQVFRCVRYFLTHISLRPASSVQNSLNTTIVWQTEHSRALVLHPVLGSRHLAQYGRSTSPARPSSSPGKRGVGIRSAVQSPARP